LVKQLHEVTIEYMRAVYAKRSVYDEVEKKLPIEQELSHDRRFTSFSVEYTTEGMMQR
jgi:hypothetical protein